MKFKSETKKAIIYSFLISISTIVIVNFFSRSIVTWGGSILWHLSNDSEVTFHDIKLDLSYTFFLAERNEERLILYIVPPYGIDFAGIIDMQKIFMGDNFLSYLKERKVIGQERIISSRIEEKEINNVHVDILIQETIDKNSSKIFLYEFWLIPSKNIEIAALRIPQGHRDIYLNLFSNISFLK